MKRIHLLLAAGFLVLIAVLTNPNHVRHKEAIKSRVVSSIQESIGNGKSEVGSDLEQLGKALGMVVGGALIDVVIENLVSTSNYGVFSLSKITWEEETRVIGIGVFGNVFITRKLDEELRKGLNLTYP